ncbi:hypothetical protein [Aliivibrio kagoshimensis]|uniref:hypothetical protein n=1 Tax=Aliivibrio kagoshimensis TaxID=2910230 RepID=UPI003D0E992A
MNKLALVVSIALSSTAFNIAANEQGTSTVPNKNAATINLEKIVNLRCKADESGYVVDAKACVQAKSNLYVHQVKFKSSFKGFIDSGTAMINVDVNHPEWGQRRNIAFKAAIQQAQINFIVNKNIDKYKTSQQKRTVVGGKPEFTSEEKNRYRSEKASLEIGAQIVDAAVEKELGTEIDINGNVSLAPLEKSEFTDSVISGEASELNVSAEMSGVYVVKTFEAITVEGEAWVSAIIRGSVNTKRQVSALYEGGAAYQPVESKIARGQDPEKWFAEHYMDLYKEFGSRLVWDKEGYPVMLTFGQASNWLQEGTVKFDRYDQNVIPSIARNDALGSMSKVFNLQGSLDSKQFMGELTGEKMTITFDGKTESQVIEQVNEMVFEMDEFAKMTSEISGMQGVKILGQYENHHAVTGKKIIGYVMAWSPKYAAESQAYNEVKGADTSAGIGGYNGGNYQDETQTENKEVATSVIESSDLMDDSDF